MSLGIGDLVKPVQGMLTPLGGTLTDAWQAVIGDRVAAWRLKNAAELQKKIDQELRAKGIILNTARIPERYAFAWFEEATKQDEPEIQQLFARLLVEAATGNDDALDRRLLAAVSQFTPDDAKAFSCFYPPSWQERNWRPNWSATSLILALRRHLGEESVKALEHLILLGMIATASDLSFDLWGVGRTPISPADLESRVRLNTQYEATELGLALSKALNQLENKESG